MLDFFLKVTSRFLVNLLLTFHFNIKDVFGILFTNNQQTYETEILGFQLKTQPCKNCGMCTAPYGYCNFRSAGFKHPDLGQEKQALACLIFLRSRFLKNCLRVFINYLEGRIKWSRGPYMARMPEVPHPCLKRTRFCLFGFITCVTLVTG